MTLIDASFVGKSSSIALAALGPAGAISDSATQLLLFLSIAATNLVASALADKDHERIRRIVSATLLVSVILGKYYIVPSSNIECAVHYPFLPLCHSHDE